MTEKEDPPYFKTVTFEGDSQNVLGTASAILMTNGFKIESRNDSRIEFSGPGMRSTRQSPILGSKSIAVKAAHGRLTVHADYGGAEWMERFMVRFPLLLGAGIAILFTLATGIVLLVCQMRGVEIDTVVPSVKWLLIIGITSPLLSVSPWIVLGPFMARQLREKTTQALDTLVANAQHSGFIG